MATMAHAQPVFDARVSATDMMLRAGASYEPVMGRCMREDFFGVGMVFMFPVFLPIGYRRGPIEERIGRSGADRLGARACEARSRSLGETRRGLLSPAPDAIGRLGLVMVGAPSDLYS